MKEFYPCNVKLSFAIIYLKFAVLNFVNDALTFKFIGPSVNGGHKLYQMAA